MSLDTVASARILKLILQMLRELTFKKDQLTQARQAPIETACISNSQIVRCGRSPQVLMVDLCTSWF